MLFTRGDMLSVIEMGGVRLYRVLQSFDKYELMATQEWKITAYEIEQELEKSAVLEDNMYLDEFLDVAVKVGWAEEVANTCLGSIETTVGELNV